LAASTQQNLKNCTPEFLRTCRRASEYCHGRTKEEEDDDDDDDGEGDADIS
jgi:hypothetical protein